jgi:trk system potassium uptake protein TrkA
LDYLPFLEGYSIIEISPPKQFIGKSLRELNLINRFGVQVVAIKELVPDRLNLIPTAQCVLKDSDIMILLGPNEAFNKLQKINS